MDAFDALPIACVVNGKYFCVHGGITDKLKSVTYFSLLASWNSENIEEPRDTPNRTLLWLHVVWSDTLALGETKGEGSVQWQQIMLYLFRGIVGGGVSAREQALDDCPGALGVPRRV